MIMNKFYALVTLFLFAVSGAANAQCNATFTTQVSGNTAQFAGVMPANTGTNLWYFGDGTSSTLASPSHTYPNCGVYTVWHSVEVANPNGTVVCNDSTFQAVNIACNTPCGAVASFTSNMVNNQTNVYQFTNTSAITPATGAVVCNWSFGDGTSVNATTLAPQVHTYAASGLFNVCLVVTTGQLGTTNICRDTFCMNVQAQVPNPTPCTIVAAFNSTATSSPSTIQFNNTSTNVSPTDSVVWNFGDGSYGFTMNPSHTYTTAGTYNVCLRIVRYITGAPPCVSEICHTVVIQSAPCNVTPTFTTQVSPSQPNVVVFINSTSPNTGLATWYFGDSTTATGNQVTHTFAQAGTYTVCMHVQMNNTCSADTCRAITIANAPSPCNMIAGFTTAPTSAVNTIAFTNTSTGFAAGDSIKWTFGDGSVSYDLNPTHAYNNSGTYQVCLWIKRNGTPAGTAPCFASLCYGVVVGTPPPCNLQPIFTATASPNQPGVYVFTNTSVTANAPSVAWSFGDSTTGTGQVVTHTYTQPGTYTVCMYVAVSNTCTADTCITVTVNGTNPNPCNLQANFSWQQTPASPGTVYFLNSTTGYVAGDSIRWTFGDGITSFINNPTHSYAAPGIYNVCLRVKHPTPAGGTPCVSEICRTITIAPPVTINCDSVVVSYNHYQDQLMPNKIRFITVSNYPVSQEQWTITDLSGTSGTPVVLNQYNPAYIFPHTGNYVVCLHATIGTNCIKEYCDTINITSIATQCMLMAYPNPAQNQVSVNAVLSAPTTVYAFVFNSQNVLLNQRIVSGTAGSNIITFNTSNLVAGNYTIRLYYNGQVCVARFQKL